MILIAWWKASRAWSADHRATWPEYTTLIDGRSRLLTDTELAVRNAAMSAGFAVADRAEEWMESIEGGQEIYVRFKLIPSGVEVWLQRDGAQIDSPAKCEIFEEWNFRTPQEFISDVSATAVEMARDTRPAV